MKARTSLLGCIYACLLIPTSTFSANLVICFDGTGNHPEQEMEVGQDTTNVWRLCDALVKDDQQKVLYCPGVGTEAATGGLCKDLSKPDNPKSELSKIFAKPDQEEKWTLWEFVDEVGDKVDEVSDKIAYRTGLGANKIKTQALEFVGKPAEGDMLFLFGFSRGAAIARDTANDLAESGAKINLIGLWDTVAAFGVPVDKFGIPFQKINLGKKLDIHESVCEAVHLVAIDESREPFAPTLIDAG